MVAPQTKKHQKRSACTFSLHQVIHLHTRDMPCSLVSLVSVMITQVDVVVATLQALQLDLESH